MLYAPGSSEHLRRRLRRYSPARQTSSSGWGCMLKHARTHANRTRTTVASSLETGGTSDKASIAALSVFHRRRTFRKGCTGVLWSLMVVCLVPEGPQLSSSRENTNDSERSQGLCPCTLIPRRIAETYFGSRGFAISFHIPVQTLPIYLGVPYTTLHVANIPKVRFRASKVHCFTHTFYVFTKSRLLHAA